MSSKDPEKKRVFQAKYRESHRLELREKGKIYGRSQANRDRQRAKAILKLKPGKILRSPHGLSLEERFWYYVEKLPNGCWQWRGSKSPQGYGQLYGSKGTTPRFILAHRFAYILKHGNIPDGLYVLHDCPAGDNRACVNWDHLWLGTHHDNVMDAVAKKRMGFQVSPNRGEQVWSHRLTNNDVLTIRTLENYYSAPYVAKLYNIGITTVRNIWRRKTWRHI